MAEPAQDQLILLLSIGTIGVLLLTVFIILFFFTYQRKMFISQHEKQKRELEFQRQMVEAQLDSQEKERVRIASDLHDSLGSLLWGAKVNATYIERTSSRRDESRESHQELMGALDHAIGVVRRIAWELTPEAFHQTGLSESLSTLCDRVNGKGLKAVFKEEGSRLWQDDRALQTFRIAQELVSNCIKHAQATELSIHLTWSTNKLIVRVEDDGVGFKLGETRSGVGWWNIEQRARQLKAEITMGKTPPAPGSSIQVTIPLMNDN